MIRKKKSSLHFLRDVHACDAISLLRFKSHVEIPLVHISLRNYQQLFDLYMNSIQLLFLYPLILTFFIIEYVEFLVDIANNKLEDNQTRIDRYT